MDHLESFFVPPEQIQSDQLVINGNEFRHLHKVKRKQKGDTVSVTDGAGNFYTVQLNEVKATRATGKITKRRRLVGESVVSITVAQGLIRSQRMDWLIEKGTELGVRQFVPVQTAFSQVKPSDLKIQRWKRLSQAALKQCGRSILPRIENLYQIKDLDDYLPRPVLFAHPGVNRTAREVVDDIVQKQADSPRTISLVIGPEGGFSDEEVDQFKQWGYHQVQVGERRLRSETASITLVSLIMNAFGEL